jgi:SAM-dependent methyltransferase
MTTTSEQADRLKVFEAIVLEDRHPSAERYRRAAAHLFHGIDLTGKRVLEIGSGAGLRSMFIGLQGARSVVSLEPGLAGSRHNYKEMQRRRLDALGLSNVEFLDADFNLWDAGTQRFDVIVSESSINHLHESSHHALHHAPTYEAYRRICGKMHHLLDSGGVACVSDAARYGFFSLTKRLGVRRPWTGKKPSANWRIHQNAGVWRRIFLDSGFQDVEIEYPLPHRLRHLGPVVANPVSNFFLRAYFYLRAWK